MTSPVTGEEVAEAEAELLEEDETAIEEEAEAELLEDEAATEEEAGMDD